MSIVFVGDSITETGRFESPPLGTGYVSLLADSLAPELVVNSGIGGDRITDLQARWNEDVLAHRPTLLSVFVGVNDTWRRFDRGEHTLPADFRTIYRELLDRALASSSPRLVLVEPFLLPINEAQQQWPADLDLKRAVVAELATEYGAALVPLQSVLGAAAASLGAAAIAHDGVHPTSHGHALIAEAWIEAVGVAPQSKRQ